MTKKYTLTVSDELAEKIEKWKEHFNLSGMFQEVMKKAIQAKEGFRQRLEDSEDMEQIIERLKRERFEAEELNHHKGKEVGLIWAKAASYQDLKYVASNDLEWFTSDGNGAPWDPRKDQVVGSHFADFFTNDPSLLDGDWDATRQWIEGWFEGVMEFWQLVKYRIGAVSDDEIPF